MTDQTLLQTAALRYHAAGFAVLPLKKDKCPAIGSWTEYQSAKPNEAKIRGWFGGSNIQTEKLGIIAGKVSGNLEVIDIDCKYDLTGTLMEDFRLLVKEHLPKLFPRLVIASTINKGFHILIKIPAESIQGNKKLASRPATDQEATRGDKVKVLIETRGNGGYIAVFPSDGYKWTQGDAEAIPQITAEERETLFTIARSFDRMPVKPTTGEQSQTTREYTQRKDGVSPFDDYNERGDVPALLEKHGWKFVYQRGEQKFYKRPGNTDSKISASFHTGLKIFYVFSTSTDFEAGRGFNPTQVYTILENAGDYSTASKQLYKDDYGTRRKQKNEESEGDKPKTTKTKLLTKQNFEIVKDGENPGVYYIEDGKKIWAFSLLEIVAETQTEIGENYGRFLRWTDSKGRVKTWSMPLKLVHKDSGELIEYLVDRGLQIGTRRLDHDRLKNYINLSQPEETIICTAKLGWNNEAYVFPDETVGNTDHRIVYQPEYMPAHKFGVKGTLSEWQENISNYCAGNSRLVFGVSLAFAASLVPVVEAQSGGFHNRGGTSSGKTTVSFVAGSVFGGSDDELGYCQSWKATANGLESVAETHNHALLCLDELAQIDGRQAADVGYMLANGSGKIRQNKTITGRRSLAWQLLFLSTGEISLADKMQEVGLDIKGGQEVRVLDIPADICEFGVFDDLHEFPDGQSFADHLRSASRKFYGSPIRAFLTKLTGTLTFEEIKHGWQKFKNAFMPKILPADKKYPHEVERAAKRFALVAFAGETATKLEITGWQSGEASKQIETVFRAWFDNRSGRGSSDAERAISQIKVFIERHGSSRFETLTSTDESLASGKTIDRAGFRKQNESGEIEYLFLPEVFRKEVCKGFDYKFVCRILDERGFLRSDAVGFQKQLKYGGVQIRPYWVSSRILQDAKETEEQKAQSADASK